MAESTWAKALDEATLWLSWQRGPEWTPARQRGLDLWLADNEVHREAYQHALRTRDRRRSAIRRLTRLNVVTANPAARRGIHRTTAFAMAAAVALAAVIAGFQLRNPTFKTGVGEQRSVVLSDGTRVLLNTSTRLEVDFNTRQRHVHLLAGEALFNVARRPDWPFVVRALDQEVTALGTEFAVRRDGGRIAITLVEGKVSVADVAQTVSDKSTPPLLLAPGDRITCAARTRTLDRPEIPRVMSWQQGVINMNSLPLNQAVEEINRYNMLKIRIEGPASRIRVGGIFRAKDPKTFAEAVSATYGLSLQEDGDYIVLSGSPEMATEETFGRPGHKSDTR